ncbi:Sirohydrochlorin ferrochelatase [Pirellulimonas nuda]|uniref:Sirohydrochlorin ferrochelatase n=1 Tax=Pirellulimonas nuda TaxID=2528009 RepID=A0A518DEM9_9BACT|nr:CbiX/SirB N-terminal domain-containing protein [Pirellulimonas nuda]QDU89928.1 Sirohydrochlorin ferrochelatase [Pirellulimonas nuda]
MNAPRETLKARVGADESVGIIVVDHGSRRDASNALLLEVAELFRRQSGMEIVEPAHMELAEPSIATAFDRCVERGAKRVVVMPYFLGPGRHWDQDIPALSAKAAARHPGVSHLVTAPLGIDPLIAAVMEDRIAVCLTNAAGAEAACNACGDGGRCRGS